MRATGCSTAACNPTLPSRSRLSGSPAPTTVCIPSTWWISAPPTDYGTRDSGLVTTNRLRQSPVPGPQSRSCSYLMSATQDQGTCPPSPPRVLRGRKTNQGGRPMKVSGALIEAIVGLLRGIGLLEDPQREIDDMMWTTVPRARDAYQWPSDRSAPPHRASATA